MSPPRQSFHRTMSRTSSIDAAPHPTPASRPSENRHRHGYRSRRPRRSCSTGRWFAVPVMGALTGDTGAAPAWAQVSPALRAEGATAVSAARGSVEARSLRSMRNARFGEAAGSRPAAGAGAARCQLPVHFAKGGVRHGRSRACGRIGGADRPRRPCPGTSPSAVEGDRDKHWKCGLGRPTFVEHGVVDGGRGATVRGEIDHAVAHVLREALRFEDGAPRSCGSWWSSVA